MAQTEVTRTPGIGFCGLLTILFIALKLTNHIGWSWVWVLAPLWIPIAFWVAIFLLIFVLALLFGGKRRKRRSYRY